MSRWVEMDEEIDQLEEIAWGYDDADEPAKAKSVRAKIAKLKSKQAAEEAECLSWKA